MLNCICKILVQHMVQYYGEEYTYDDTSYMETDVA